MTRRALVVGGAACVWDDLDAAADLGEFDAVLAVNDMVAAYAGPVDFAVSLHPEHFAEWCRRRDDQGFTRPGKFIAHKGNTLEGRREVFPELETVEYRWPGMSVSGSSGLFAVKVALENGFDRIVLCGVPMDAEAHFFDAAPWEHFDTFRPAWTEQFNRYAPYTRSMSGWTRALLGAPTMEWLRS